MRNDNEVEVIPFSVEYYEKGKTRPDNPKVRPVAIDCDHIANRLKENFSSNASPSRSALSLVNNLADSINRGDTSALDDFVDNMGKNLSALEKKILKSVFTDDFNNLQKLSNQGFLKNVRNKILGNTVLYKQNIANLVDHIAQEQHNIVDNQSFPSAGQLADKFQLDLREKIRENLSNLNGKRLSVEEVLEQSNLQIVSGGRPASSPKTTATRSFNFKSR